MRILRLISIALLIMALMSFTLTPISYSSSNDDNHLSANDSVYSPPGYMNKDIQQARTLADKYLANKDKADNKTEATQKEVSQKVQTQAVEKPKPVLKQKQSTANKTQASTSALTISAPSNIKRGSGADKRDIDGNLISQSGKAMMSEVINGVRHNYAGFTANTADTVQTAINRAAAGDVVIVKKNNTLNQTSGIYAGFSITKALRVYGGYDDNGNISGASKVYGGFFGVTFKYGINIDGAGDSRVEIGGFDATLLPRASGTSLSTLLNLLMSMSKGAITVNNSRSVIINNCTTQGLQGLFAKNSSLSIYNSTINGSWAGIKASSSNITAVNNKIGGLSTGVGSMISTFPGVMFLLGGPKGNGIVGDNSIFSLVNNAVTGYGQKITLNNNSQVSYPKPQITKAPERSSYGEFKSASINANPYSADGHKLNKTGEMLKGLLNNKEPALQGGVIPVNAKATNQGLDAAALSAAGGAIDPEYMDVAMRLASILKDPTEDQKVILDVIKALLKDTFAIQEGKEAKPDFKKATDDLLNAVANILLAQAMPDLIKSGDVSNIKAMFSELDTQRNKIMLEYAQSTKPYYENMIKDLAKNMAMLQAKNLLNPNMSKEELSKLPPSELDKILDKIRNMPNQSFEEKYLLQQEAKYRQDYLDPNNKKLEEDMKGMLKSFTQKINTALTGDQPAQK